MTQELRVGTEETENNTGLDSIRVDNAEEAPTIDDTVLDNEEREEGDIADDPDRLKRKRLKVKSVETGTQAG